MSTHIWSDNTRGSLRSHWWIAVVRGIVALFFSISIFARPGPTLGVLTLFFGGFALASGLLAMFSAIGLVAHHKQWWTILIEGIAGVVVGMITLFWPAATILSVLLLIAFWAVFTGVFQFIASVSKFGPAGGRWLLGIGGVLSVALGILLMAMPVVGVVAIVKLLGIYLLLFGIDQIFLGFQLRHLDRWIDTRAHPAGA